MSVAMEGDGLHVDRSLPVSGQVRSVFEQCGGDLTTRQLAELCHALGVKGFTDDDAAEKAMSAWTNQVREYLKEKDEKGLPFAGQSGQPGQRKHWLQRHWWDVPTYRVNVGEYIRQRDDNDRIARGLGSECSERHGVDPYAESADSTDADG